MLSAKYNCTVRKSPFLCKMNIQLICSDIDGTLLNKDRELSKITINQVKRLSHIPFILISSRMPKAMIHLQKEFGNTHLPLIAYNGGLLIDNGVIIDSTEISVKIISALFNEIKKSDLHLSLYHNDEWFVSSMDYWAKRESNNTKVIPIVQTIETTISNWKNEDKGAHKIMVMGDKLEIDALGTFIGSNFTDEIIAYRSKDTYLEIAHKSISKKTAIETLLNSHYPKLSMENVLAFGDNYNDIAMIESVGIGVAVKNGVKEIIAVSDATTDGNKEDGVANYLKSLN